MDATLEQRTLDAEDDHWWYRGRLKIVLDAAGRLAAAMPRRPENALDVGCGGGATLAALRHRFDLDACGVEPSARARARARVRDAGEIIDAWVEDLPFSDADFDLALCLDVLEYVADDGLALRELSRVVRRDGGLVVTAPAHPRLWSRHDDLNEHRRRYRRPEFVAVAQGAGWEVIQATHFNTILLPVAVAARALDRGDGLDVPAPPVNRALEAMLSVERRAIKRGIDFPFGLSLLAELRLPGTS